MTLGIRRKTMGGRAFYYVRDPENPEDKPGKVFLPLVYGVNG